MAHDPREPASQQPFTDEEAAFARLYTALPRSEPPPALDARVLAQARAAVAPVQQRKPRPWFLMPGAGVAAAAVLAAGIAWQVNNEGSKHVIDAEPAASQAVVAPAAKVDAEQKQRVDIDYVRKEQSAVLDRIEQQAQPAPAPEAAVGAARATAKKPVAAPAARAQPKAEQEFVPEPPPVVMEDTTPMSVAAPPPAPPAPPAIQSAPAPEEASDAAASAPGMTAPQLGAAAAGNVDRRRVSPPADALPPWPQDDQLAPDPWLERIRERVRLGDRQGAQFSLRRFVLANPRRDVPADLQRLLAE